MCPGTVSHSAALCPARAAPGGVFDSTFFCWKNKKGDILLTETQVLLAKGGGGGTNASSLGVSASPPLSLPASPAPLQSPKRWSSETTGGILNNFLTRGFSSILESAAIIVLLSVSLMPAHSAPAQKVDLLPWFKAPSGLAATLAQWRHCGPRLLLVTAKTKTRSNL